METRTLRSLARLCYFLTVIMACLIGIAIYTMGAPAPSLFWCIAPGVIGLGLTVAARVREVNTYSGW